MPKVKVELLPDLRLKDYHKSGIISKSGLWAFKGKLEGSVNRFKVKQSTFRFGQLFHEAIYEPALFVSSDEYVNAKVTKNPKNEDVKLVNHIERMATAARKDFVLSTFLKHKEAKFERACWALINGIPVQVKLDCHIPKSIHDAKTTACNTREAFIQSCSEYGYWEQAALYKLVTQSKNFYFLGVSKAEPHKTFPVDCSKFKKEMKEAEANILFLLDTYAKLHPNYLKTALKNWKL